MRLALALLITVACAFGVIGCSLALLFELQGFGTPRDQGPRTLYVSALVGGSILSLLAPVLTWKLLAKGTLVFNLLVAGLAFALALLLFGLSWAG
jgi:hypothetical protein